MADLFRSARLEVNQAVDDSQWPIGHSAKRYDLRANGASFATAAEVSEGLSMALSRTFNPFYESTIHCTTLDNSRLLRLVFPFGWPLRRCDVFASDNQPLGSVVERFHLFRFRADVLDPNGRALVKVFGPVFKLLSSSDWVFEVRSEKKVLAHIRKQWGGWYRESFTRADDFTIDFAPECTDPGLRKLLLATVLLIDKVKFDRQRNSLAVVD